MFQNGIIVNILRVISNKKDTILTSTKLYCFLLGPKDSKFGQIWRDEI